MNCFQKAVACSIWPLVALAFVWAAPRSAIALDFNKCVIIMFEPNVMTLPEGVNQCSLDSVSVSLSPIEAILQADSASVVAAFAPDFQQADTVGTTRLGVEYRITDWSRTFFVQVASAAAVDSLVDDLQGVDGVIDAEPAKAEYIAMALPYAFPSPCMNDEVFVVGDQWQFQNFGLDAGGQLSPGTADADIDLVEAWEIARGVNIRVAVFDYGVWADNPDLSGRVFGDAIPSDHGTAVAGIIAAKADNLVAISGINPQAEISSHVVLTEDYFHLIRDAVARVIDGTIPIINMSYVTTGGNAEQRAMRDAYNAGVFLVAAVRWNASEGYDYPGRYNAVTAVGYTDNDDHVPLAQDTTTWIDLVAPGENVISLDEQGGTVWAVWSGTSLAVPHVCGVASLLLSLPPGLNIDLDNDDLREIIIRSTDDIHGTGEWTSEYGHGRLNAEKALEMALFPNELYRVDTNSGNEVEGTTMIANMTLRTAEFDDPRSRTAKRYEVRRDVTFPVTYPSPPHVWGRGASTTGYNTDNPNWGWRFCEVVDSTVTTSGCTLRTYVYELFNSDGSHYIWVPKAPEDVHFACTVVGRVDHQYRIKSYVRPHETTDLLSMPQHWAVGCPGGDVDTIIVKVALDAQDFEAAPPREEFTLSQPHNAKGSLFPDCSTLIADHDAVFATDPDFPNGCYETSFSTTTFAGFCGVDSARVRFRGGLLGYVPLNIRSPDMVSVPSSRGKVSLEDYDKFVTYYSSPPKPYEERADFVAPTDVQLGDFCFFVTHYANGGHQYTPPGLLAGAPAVVQGNAVVDISESPVVNGERSLQASVRLENVDAYEVALLAFRCNNPRLEFVSWEQSSAYTGQTMCAQADVGYDRVLAVGLVGGKNTSGSFGVGSATFRVLGTDSLVLDEEDFAPVISDILLQNGVEGPMAASRVYGSEVRMVNSLKQNFPNPFNPETTILYSLKDANRVILTIYDVAGRRVRELVNGRRVPGAYRVVWDGRDAKGTPVASGVYFYKLVAGRFVDTRKMVLLK